MPSPGQDFKKSLASWADKAGEQFDGLARQSAQRTAEIAVLNTPVDTSFLRGMWQPAIGTPSSEVMAAPGGDSKEANAAAATAAVQSRVGITIAQFKAGMRFYFTNGTSYARAQEYGTATMAGRFFVQKAVKRWKITVAEVAAELGIGK